MKCTTTKAPEMRYVRALVHGDSGIGKTTSLLTLPPDKTVIALTERGTVPLRKHDYPVMQLESWDDIRQMVSWLKTPTNADEAIRKQLQDAKVIVLDSLLEAGQLCQRDIVTVARPKVIQERSDGKRETPLSVYADLLTMEDWGLYRKRMLSMIAALCQLPYHIICTCVSALVEDKQTGKSYRLPGLGGKSATECGRYFDLMLHMESTDDGSRVWRTKHSGLIVCKDASGVLDEFEATNWSKLFRKIIGNNGSPTKGKAK